jgi:hypothetical protein
MAVNVAVTVLPYIPPRKSRIHEPKVHCVKWAESSLDGIPTIYFRWFSRDTAAVNFLNNLVDRGIAARLTSKP